MAGFGVSLDSGQYQSAKPENEREFNIGPSLSVGHHLYFDGLKKFKVQSLGF